MSESYADLMKTESHFSEAVKQFDSMIKRLSSTELLDQAHGEVEQWLSVEGNELLRRLYQAYFDQQSEQEPMESSVEGAEGIVRTHRRVRRKQLSTLFGKIAYHRIGYSQTSAPALYPLDRELSIGPTRYSDGLRYRVAEECSKNSFDDCVASIDSTTGGHVPKRQCEQLVAQTAQDFEAYYRANRTEEKSSSNLLVLTTDSKGIVMKREDLRPETRKAAEADLQKKRKARLSPGEKKNRKRMATAASVYSVPACIRSAEQVMNLSVEESKPERPKIENKRVWASVERGESSVVAEAFEEALSRDPEQQRDWVVVVDGEVNQLNYIEQQLLTLDLTATVVLDFIHVLEYIWKAAYCFHPVGSEEAEQWVAENALKLLQGKSREVGAGMRRLATRKDLSQDQRKPVDKCADYLKNNRPYLNYDQYLSAGYPIASGVIEGACRHLINDRMSITGARWGLETAESILKLRSLRSSGDLNDYWRFHKQKEQERNHESRYKNPELLKTA